MTEDDQPAPIDLPYVKCDPCIAGDHDSCRGMDLTEPVCGCRCPWLEVIDP